MNQSPGILKQQAFIFPLVWAILRDYTELNLNTTQHSVHWHHIVLPIPAWIWLSLGSDRKSSVSNITLWNQLWQREAAKLWVLKPQVVSCLFSHTTADQPAIQKAGPGRGQHDITVMWLKKEIAPTAWSLTLKKFRQLAAESQCFLEQKVSPSFSLSLVLLMWCDRTPDLCFHPILSTAQINY